MGVSFLRCPHCRHSHRGDEQVRLCALYRGGYRWVDADGFVCNGPFTRPGGGSPKEPKRLASPEQGDLFA